MAAQAGRKARVKYDADGAGAGTAAVVAGARMDRVSINNEPIVITDKGDNGIQHLLNDIASQKFDLQCQGVCLDDTLVALAHGATESAALHYFEFDLDGIFNLRGRWFINSLTVEGTDGPDPATFDMSLTSHDTITLASS